MASPFEYKLDTRAQDELMRRFRAAEVEKVQKRASHAGALAGGRVLKGQAPIGTAAKLSSIYRRLGLRHGALRGSVRAAAIRGRGTAIKGLQGRTIGEVIGPIGRNAFTRYWREAGFEHVGGKRIEGTHWLARAAAETFAVAHEVSTAILDAYGRE